MSLTTKAAVAASMAVMPRQVFRPGVSWNGEAHQCMPPVPSAGGSAPHLNELFYRESCVGNDAPKSAWTDLLVIWNQRHVRRVYRVWRTMWLPV